jgi:hypothetical protein
VNNKILGQQIGEVFFATVGMLDERDIVIQKLFPVYDKLKETS